MEDKNLDNLNDNFELSSPLIKTESNEVLDEIDIIGGIPVKSSQSSLGQTQTKLPLFTPEEKLEIDKWEAISNYQKNFNKKKLRIFFACLIFVLISVIAYFTYNHYNKYSAYENKKILNLGKDTVITMAKFKNKRIKNMIVGTNFYEIDYWSLNSKELSNYAKLLVDNKYYKGKKQDRTIFVKEANESGNFIIIEHLGSTLIYRKNISYITEFDLDIFGKDYKSYTLKKMGNNDIAFLDLPDTFVETFSDTNMLIFKGDMIKSLSIIKEELRNMETLLTVKENDLIFNGYEIMDKIKEEGFNRIDAYNKDLSLWQSSFIFENNAYFVSVNLIKANQDDYLDQLIMKIKY